MSLHDQFLAELGEVAQRIQLVARLRDDRLGFPGPDDLRLFVPDLHLVSGVARQRYSYGTNDTSLLADLLSRIAAWKARSSGQTIALYQVGDFLDLWREEPIASERRDAASKIAAHHVELMQAFLNPTLRARFLLGNHDFDLYRWPNYTAWERRYFLPPRGSLTPAGIALHGDLFDWLELLPNPINQFFSYFFSPLLSAPDHDLRAIRVLVEHANGQRDFRQQISGSADVGAVHTGAIDTVPDEFNLGSHELMPRARDCIKAANKAYGLDLRFAVIGHTHRARIAVHRKRNEFFALIDCGAWIEEGFAVDPSTGAIRRFPNQQITVLSNNEVRIYQVER